MNKKNLKYFLSVCLILAFSVVYANKTPPLPKPSGPPGPGLVPIDGGIFYLITSGIIFGVYTLKKKK